MRLECFEKFKVLLFFFLQFHDQFYTKRSSTFDETLQLTFLTLGDDWLLVSDFIYELVYVSSTFHDMYSGDKLSKSIDFVSTSPLLRMYYSRMPGG